MTTLSLTRSPLQLEMMGFVRGLFSRTGASGVQPVENPSFKELERRREELRKAQAWSATRKREQNRGRRNVKRMIALSRTPLVAESICDAKSSNKPWRTPGGPKKFAVCADGKLVRFGDPNLEIKRDDPARRKNFRARHRCHDPGPRTKAKYWACKTWERGKTVSDIVR